MAGKTLHSRFELALEQRHNDGLIQQLVFAPGHICCSLIVQVVVFLLLVSLSVVRLRAKTEKRIKYGTEVPLQLWMDGT